MELTALRPLLVPVSYLGKAWNPPHVLLRHPSLALTWVFLSPGGGAITYIDAESIIPWETAGVDWQAQALANLKRESTPLWTREKRSLSGALLSVGMFQPDGLGSTRVLLREALSEAFPQGYWVAIPERSCGIVISQAHSVREVEDYRSLVLKCHKDAARPFLSEMFDPVQLEPAGMAEPEAAPDSGGR
jgi:hypothetical protein